jgi:hypothetical protein
LNRGIDERRRQKKTGRRGTDARSHLPILQSNWLGRKTRADM